MNAVIRYGDLVGVGLKSKKDAVLENTGPKQASKSGTVVLF
jgi:hypothetical protein